MRKFSFNGDFVIKKLIKQNNEKLGINALNGKILNMLIIQIWLKEKKILLKK